MAKKSAHYFPDNRKKGENSLMFELVPPPPPYLQILSSEFTLPAQAKTISSREIS